MAEIPNKKKLPMYAGLKVLVIDHDPTVLQNIEKMCTEHHYQVITCSTFQAALNHIRETDVILMEVEMPNMNGYEFLQHVSKEVDVPVFAMSNDDSEKLIVKAIKHGVFYYIKKPLTEEHITKLWQPVVRKAYKEDKLEEKFGNLESECGTHDSAAAAVKESPERIMEDQRRITSPKDSDRDGLDDCYEPLKKKRRVVWDKGLHDKFVGAMKILGPDKSVPKKILEVMNVPYLTRENVASHLQKYRHQYKDTADEKPREKQNGIQLSSSTVSLSRDIGQTVAVIHPHPHPWPPNHSHAAAEQGVSRNHPVKRCPSNMSPDDESLYRAAWLATNAAAMRVNNNSVGMQQQAGNHVNSAIINTFQHSLMQQQQDNHVNSAIINTLQQQQQQQSLMQHRMQMENPANSFNQNNNFGGNSLGVVPIPAGQNNNVRGIFHGYGATPVSLSQQDFANAFNKLFMSSKPPAEPAENETSGVVEDDLHQ